MTVRIAAFFLALVVCLVPTATQAQITIEATDLQTAFSRGMYGKQTLSPQAGETAKIQFVLDQVGAGGTYDFSSVDVSASFSENEIRSRPFDSSVPSDPAFDDADYVDISSIFGTSPTYSFLGIESSPGGDPDGLYDYGDATPSSFLSTKTTNEPGLRVLPLPLTAGTTWSSATVTQRTYLNGVLDSTAQVTNAGEVIGYGTLILPGGTSIPALVHSFTQVEDSDTLQSVSFLTKQVLASVTILIDENGDVLEMPTGTGSSAPVAFFQFESRRSASDTFAAGETGSFLGGSLGATVDITAASGTGSTLRGYWVDFASAQNGIDDSGSPAGFPVENVTTDGYWVVEADAFDGTYTICLDYSGLSGISDETELAVLKRSNSAELWATLASTVDTGAKRVCASGQQTFSEFSIGGSSANALPVELTRFDAVQGADGVVLTWETASETQNAGFHVERSGGDGIFRRIAFRDGAGTTTQSRAYRFVDTTVPFTESVLSYQLRQVDVDGTTSLSKQVLVRRSVPEAVELQAPYPNPVRTGATLRYTLPEAADVEISVYNVLGQRVAVLVRGRQDAGRFERSLDVSRLRSGLYFVRLAAGSTVTTRSLSVVQ